MSTDNRLLALGAKVIIHDYQEALISGAQQGFLTGRSMLANIFEMDYLSKIYVFKPL